MPLGSETLEALWMLRKAGGQHFDAPKPCGEVLLLNHRDVSSLHLTRILETWFRAVQLSGRGHGTTTQDAQDNAEDEDLFKSQGPKGRSRCRPIAQARRGEEIAHYP